ncbi:MAG: hypothetical protein E6R05_04830 [Candidatus Moraniibacteriota bacterium]|nr:MAG: hypothetical protein E6R05_04830 [Candidatus Moranbacteria bacterium]
MFQYQSAALVLVDARGRFYCVRELQSKPAIGKIVGSKDYSFPWETREVIGEHHERLWLTLHRTIVEEIDATDTLDIDFPVPIGRVDVHASTAHVFVARFKSGPEEMRGTHAGIEVEPLGWLTREELLSRCRDGVREIIALWDRHQQECQAC